MYSSLHLSFHGAQADTKILKMTSQNVWDPMECETNDFKHERFDGDAFDLEVSLFPMYSNVVVIMRYRISIRGYVRPYVRLSCLFEN